MIGMTAFSDFSVVPSTIHSALIPSTSTNFMFKEDMTSTFSGRLQNFILNAIVRFLRVIYIDRVMDEMVSKAVDGKYQVLGVEQLRQRATLLLINYNEFIDGVEQLPPNVIGVGGLQIQQPKQLSMVRTEELCVLKLVKDGRIKNEKSKKILFFVGFRQYSEQRNQWPHTIFVGNKC